MEFMAGWLAICLYLSPPKLQLARSPAGSGSGKARYPFLMKLVDLA